MLRLPWKIQTQSHTTAFRAGCALQDRGIAALPCGKPGIVEAKKHRPIQVIKSEIQFSGQFGFALTD
jgi:hypothetical protein